MKKLLLGLTGALSLMGASAFAAGEDAAAAVAQPTFYKDILPILQDNCQACHRDQGQNLGGMVAPMALSTFEQTRPYLRSMSALVAAKKMPPWHATPATHGQFENERTLTDAQIQTIVNWVKNDGPAGDPATAPPIRDWSKTGAVDGWSIGKPDLIIKTPAHVVGDEVEDNYSNLRTEITKEMLPEDRWIRAVEFRPGSKVVHHIIASPLGGIAPGNDPLVFREGMGQKLSAGSTVTWQMHYHKTPGVGTAVTDVSEAAIIFWPKDAEIKYPVKGDSLGTMQLNIPPNSADYRTVKEFTFASDSRILSVMPHMHVRGSLAKYDLVYPDGKTETMLDVPKYDFNWQTRYRYTDPKFVPAGTKLVLTLGWDNTVNNPSNPDPNKAVRWGQPTTAEMSFGWLQYIGDKPVDISKMTAEELQGANEDPTQRPAGRGGRGAFGGRGGRGGARGGNAGAGAENQSSSVANPDNAS